MKPQDEVVVNENLLMESNREKESVTKTFNVGAYHSLDETYKWMDQLAKKNSDLVTRIYMKKSSMGNPLTTGPNKPAIWIECGSIARDWISVSTGIWIANKTVTDRNDVSNILNFMDIYLVIVANPDGYDYSQKEDRFWSKTRMSYGSVSCPGVCLDRNWLPSLQKDAQPDRFSFYNPCSHHYPGIFALSEMEAANMAEFIKAHGNVQLLLSLQSYKPRIMFPPGHNCEQMHNKTQSLKNVAKATAKSLFLRYGTKYRVGSLCRIRAPEVSSVIDWAYENHIKYSFVFGLRDYRGHGFLTPYHQIIPIATETWAGLKQIMASVMLRLRDDQALDSMHL
ncbi:hypothetical protein WMY93_023150 [Mugilogobius chulae]|uniref:Peptidase M14 domain-containing protein n=1 Tax=Mugilogobius chulae TaxID=88201 RepID=A0AAW0N914_9GOBI